MCGEDNSIEALEGPEFEIDPELHLDKLQPWSRIKHDIIEKYLAAYTTILRKQQWVKRYIYYDAFAGAGVAIDSNTDALVAAGALRALEAEPRFSEYHFIDSNPRKLDVLEHLARGRSEVHLHRGDYREILPKLLTRCRYEDFARGLCILDPYGLSVDYSLLKEIAGMKSLEIFFNFMLVGANRNVLWNADPASLSPKRKALMTRVWGNDKWATDLYELTEDLFGVTARKVNSAQVIEGYRDRLYDAGFKYVPPPIGMKNRMNAPLYYLFFCSQNGTAAKIADDVMSGYRHSR